MFEALNNIREIKLHSLASFFNFPAFHKYVTEKDGLNFRLYYLVWTQEAYLEDD